MAAAGMDCVIRGGTLVNAEGRRQADVGIQGGTIAQIGGEMRAPSEIDAAGLLVLPGGIDAHVHLTDVEPDPESCWVDDFTSGSEAAFVGGVTTLGNMTFPRPDETPGQSLEREAAVVAEQAIADVFLHPVLIQPTPQAIAELPALVAAGHSSIKFFMSAPSFDQHAAEFILAARVAAEAGAITLIHCEDHAIVQCCTAALVRDGRTSLEHFADSRPALAEVVATQRAVALCEVAGAPIYVVHLSCERALRVCQEGRARGLPVYVETRPVYLHLTRDCYHEPGGAKYVVQPPLREASDVAALWDGLARGLVDTVCTDHAPWTLAQKLDPSLNLARHRPGVANLETMLPMLYSQGVRTGRLSLERFVALSSTNAARLFGLYPRKGAIAVGSDADLVLWDDRLTHTVCGAELPSRARHSVFDGLEVTGWPKATWRRGELVYDRGRLLGRPGSGRLVARGPSERLEIASQPR